MECYNITDARNNIKHHKQVTLVCANGIKLKIDSKNFKQSREVFEQINIQSLNKEVGNGKRKRNKKG